MILSKVRIHRAAWLCVMVLLGLSPAAGRADSATDAASAERLVQTHWFEGLPYARARALTPVGIARVAQILADPAKAEWHANAVTALGMSGHAAAYPALRQFQTIARSGEVSRQTYRALMALPLAMGHLGRGDARALADLEAAVDHPVAATWSYKHLRGSRLDAQIRTQCLNGLGVAGRVEKLRELAETQLLPRGATDAVVLRHQRDLAEATKLADRVARDGADRVFGGNGSGREGFVR